jgi:hypothetical protein
LIPFTGKRHTQSNPATSTRAAGNRIGNSGFSEEGFGSPQFTTGTENSRTVGNSSRIVYGLADVEIVY